MWKILQDVELTWAWGLEECIVAHHDLKALKMESLKNLIVESLPPVLFLKDVCTGITAVYVNHENSKKTYSNCWPVYGHKYLVASCTLWASWCLQYRRICCSAKCSGSIWETCAQVNEHELRSTCNCHTGFRVHPYLTGIEGFRWYLGTKHGLPGAMLKLDEQHLIFKIVFVLFRAS